MTTTTQKRKHEIYVEQQPGGSIMVQYEDGERYWTANVENDNAPTLDTVLLQMRAGGYEQISVIETGEGGKRHYFRKGK